MTHVAGIDDEVLTRWLADHVGLRPPIDATLIAGGRSNLTYRIVDAAGRTVALRRPPVHHVLPTAHDMVREHTILTALAPQGVPVPTPLALCTDAAVADHPFYVMDFVEGAILRDRAQAEATFPLDVRARIGDHLAETLAHLHRVDLERSGLSGLARHDGYIERQVRRWRSQYEQTYIDEGPDHSGVLDVADALARDIPTQQRTTVVHGDYRLDNVVLDGDGRVRAILDWEICTLGDPLGDLGMLLVYWAEPTDPMASLLGSAPSTAPGFSSRADVLAAYAARSDLDLSNIAYYQAFGYWKLACILQGIYARYRAGATAGDRGSVDEFPAFIARLASLAAATLEQ